MPGSRLLLDLRLRSQRLHPAHPWTGGVAGLLREVAGLQAQDAPAALLGVRARTRGLSAADVERARVDDRALVRTWAMRGTLHLLSAEDAAWLIPLLGPRFERANRGRRAQLGLDDAATDRGVGVIRDALREHGPLSRADLRAHLARRRVPQAGQALIHLIGCAAQRGVCVYGPLAGREMLFALLDDWCPAARPAPLPEDAAVRELARRFLLAFGPAAPADLAQWAGLSAGEARQAFAALGGELVAARFGPETLWLPAQRADWLTLEPDPSVRLLPAFDNYLLAYADRAPYLDPAHAPRVMAGGLIRPALLVDGVVRGVWKTTRARQGHTVELAPFAPLPPARARAAEAEAADVVRFLAG